MIEQMTYLLAALISCASCCVVQMVIKMGKPSSPLPETKKTKWLPDQLMPQPKLYDENDIVEPITKW